MSGRKAAARDHGFDFREVCNCFSFSTRCDNTTNKCEEEEQTRSWRLVYGFRRRHGVISLNITFNRRSVAVTVAVAVVMGRRRDREGGGSGTWGHVAERRRPLVA
ncbi:hypothetical protein J6590_059710 [Homalodisca vitripennis]|nr:hypothetical protein J6590_059710 [Homalodisca vitripennis]